MHGDPLPDAGDRHRSGTGGHDGGGGAVHVHAQARRDRDRRRRSPTGRSAAARSRARTIGLYWEGGQDAAADAFKQILTDNGLNLASEIQTGGPGTVGNEQDALAAQKFQADGVDLVVFFVGSSGIVELPAGRRRPGLHAGVPRPRLGVAHERRRRRGLQPGPVGGRRGAVGDAARRAARSQPDAEACIANYESFSGKTIDRNPPEKSGEFSNILIACELGNILLEGIRGATADGGELTQDSFIAAVEAIQDCPGQAGSTRSASVADDHTAPADVREVTWDTACPCWRATPATGCRSATSSS